MAGQGPARADESYRGLRGVLQTLGPRTRTLALVLVVVDSIFGASIFSTGVVSHLSGNDFEVAVICAAALLLASIVAITLVELLVEQHQAMTLQRSSHTPSSEVLDALVKSTLEMICRVTSLPHAPDIARMRAFIFRVEGDELVCSHYWALNPTSEKVGVTRFPLTEEAGSRVAVVKCALEQKITRTPVDPLPTTLVPGDENVAQDLTFVLAAPILDEKKRIWGTVDFDTSSDLGRDRLLTQDADAAIFQLTQHLQVIFELGGAASKPPAAAIAAR
jgi:hypothetical protein